MIRLQLKFNGALVKELGVEKGETTIGRRPENDLVIDNPAVSGLHCRVLFEQGQYFIEDLNSTNGTFLKGTKVSRAPLRHLDELSIAKHTVVFVNEQEASASAVPAKAAPVSSDSTVIMTAPPPKPSPPQGGGWVPQLRVMAGDQASYHELTSLTTYIGKSRQAQIKLTGLFAPDLAACIVKKADGFHLTALRDKLVRLNGTALMDQAEVPLNEGDSIDVGPLKMVYLQRAAGAA